MTHKKKWKWLLHIVFLIGINISAAYLDIRLLPITILLTAIYVCVYNIALTIEQHFEEKL